MSVPLISIIIPTYNRAHLIGETLESILEQTYKNWECIVIDDGSEDDTASVMEDFCSRDTRIKYVVRPDGFLAGGNGARNYGLTLAKGSFVQWFDSDDLMQPDNIALKIKGFYNEAVDFVIAKTTYFNHPKSESPSYNFNTEEVDFNSYAMGSVNWFTPDALIKMEKAKKIAFNEQLKAGQEYNYFCKLLLLTKSMVFIDEFTTLRRYTPNSIGENRRKDPIRYFRSRFQVYWLNYLDIKGIAKNSKFDKFSLLTCLSCYYRIYPKIAIPSNFIYELKKVFGYKMVYFYLARLSLMLFGRYHYFYNKLKR